MKKKFSEKSLKTRLINKNVVYQISKLLMVKVEARISVCVFVDVDYLELFCLYCRMVILEPGIRCNNIDVLFAN